MYAQDGWTPTGILRWVEQSNAPTNIPPEGQSGPAPETLKVLQQLWDKAEPPHITEWRDVPTQENPE